eukprot:scaffold36266_cov140-Isochrysis_galbana.AAC.2
MAARGGARNRGKPQLYQLGRWAFYWKGVFFGAAQNVGRFWCRYPARLLWASGGHPRGQSRLICGSGGPLKKKREVSRSPVALGSAAQRRRGSPLRLSPHRSRRYSPSQQPMEAYARAPPSEIPVAPGDPRTLGFGTDQARWLKEELRRKEESGGAANPFR